MIQSLKPPPFELFPFLSLLSEFATFDEEVPVAAGCCWPDWVPSPWTTLLTVPVPSWALLTTEPPFVFVLEFAPILLQHGSLFEALQ